MLLGSVQRHWNGLARRDPLWAVLTEHDKQGRRWSESEFFATGEAAINAELQWARMHVPDLVLGHALDFGCGVGRLTRALARRFDRVTGVDISETMLALASRYVEQPNVTFRHNRTPDLRQFDDGVFDYVTSEITLQHMAPRYARRYIAEFVRVCAAGGIITFQVPAYVPPEPKERFKWSWWPPTLWTRVCRFTRRGWERFFPPEPTMEVHAVPRDVVIHILEGAGARVLAVEANTAAGTHIESYRYLARRVGAPRVQAAHAANRQTGTAAP